MRQFWSNSKEKLVAAEEGQANFEPLPKNGCKNFMQLVQFVLVIEIALFLGWACLSFYQSKYVTPVDVRENHLRISALKSNFKLTPESPNDSDVITWQEKPSQNKVFDPPSSSEPWLAKTQIIEIPESSTERDSVLLNEDSVNHPQSSPPDIITPPEIKTSTEHVQETIKNFEEKIKTLEAEKIEKLEEDPNKIALDLFHAQKAIEKLNIFENLATESEIGIPVATQTPIKRVEEVKETSSEIPQLPILVSKIDDSSSRSEEFEKELEQEIEKFLDGSNNNSEFSLPSFNPVLHHLEKAEALSLENISTTEIVSPNIKKYHFRFSMGPETGIQKSDDNENSQEISKQLPFFIHVSFNVSDGDGPSAENADSVLKGEENVLEPASPFIEPRISGEPKSEDSPLDEDTLKWWVSIPQFQETQVGGWSDEESQPESSILTSASEKEESAKKSFFDFFFNKPDSQSVNLEPNEVEDKPNEVFEVQPENSDTISTDTDSQIFPDEDLIDKFMNEIKEQSAMELNEKNVKEMIPEETSVNEETLEKQMEDFIKALANVKISDEDRKITGTQNESHSHQEESMTMEKETVSEENPDSTEESLDWKNEENWFHSQPTWKEETDGYLNDLFKNLEHEIDEYDDSINFDSTYDD